jgi:ABC-2 type transport system ATP-binding protein
MIEVRGLTKRYGRLAAVDDVSFHVDKGEILGFLGPNGAGKTTTVRILTCFFPATSGEAKVAGFDVAAQSLEVRKRIGYLPENVPLYQEMRTRKYLEFVAETHGVYGRKKRSRAAEAIEQCGLESVADRVIRHISKGFRQRVGLAQALIHNPEILILDEPTVGLDPKQIIEIRQLIRSLGGERTIILCSHILPEVVMTCGRVVIINQGRIVADDTPEGLTTQLQKSAQVAIEVEGPVEQVENNLARVPGVTSVIIKEKTDGGSARFIVESQRDKDVRRELSRTVFEHGWDLLEIRSVAMSLEDIFVRLVTEEEEA